MFIAENEGDQIKKKERKTWHEMNRERERERQGGECEEEFERKRRLNE